TFLCSLKLALIKKYPGFQHGAWMAGRSETLRAGKRVGIARRVGGAIQSREFDNAMWLHAGVDGLKSSRLGVGAGQIVSIPEHAMPSPA
ncbi:hypothetical protein, partial [Dokdonella sp.]|uniref:hypothetical protein n=1 Tax=Dokdonella sp. TaxID=2291710 RepID=UPI003C616496